MKVLVKCLAEVLIHYVYGIPLIHQRENGHFLTEWTILAVPQIKLPHYLEENTQGVPLNLGRTLWEPHPSGSSLNVTFSGKCFLILQADLATPFPLTQLADHFSSVTLSTLPCSYLCCLYLNFLKARTAFYSARKSLTVSNIVIGASHNKYLLNEWLYDWIHTQMWNKVFL